MLKMDTAVWIHDVTIGEYACAMKWISKIPQKRAETTFMFPTDCTSAVLSRRSYSVLESSHTHSCFAKRTRILESKYVQESK